MVFDPTGPIPERRLLHRHRTIAGTHRCFHRSIQRDSTALRLDQEKGLPAAVQEPPYHSTLIPGTSAGSKTLGFFQGRMQVRAYGEPERCALAIEHAISRFKRHG